jgi:hypothetical protein
MSDHIGTTEARQEGFYWVVLGQNPRLPTGSAASGGSLVIPSPGSPRR